MKKGFNLLLAFIFTYFIFQGSVIAARTKITENSDATILNYGTSANSDYAYSFRVNANTKMGENNIDDFSNIRVTKTDDRIIFIPENNEGSGKTYLWVKDVGKYNGKQVDLKLTFYWKVQTVDSTKIYPFILVNLNRDEGLIDYMFKTLTFEVKHEIYSEGKPLNLNMSFLLGDIDMSQYFGVKTNTGSINSIQSVTGSRLYLDNGDGYKWVYDYKRDHSDSTIGIDGMRQHTARFELKNTNSFNLVVGSDLDIYSYSDIFTAPIVDAVDETTGELVLSPARAKEVLLEYNDLILTTNDVGAGLVTLEANAYGPYDLPKPLLFIRDTDNNLKTHTAMNSVNQIITYQGFTQVPFENPEYYYDGYEYEITLPSEVKINDYKVTNESDADVTEFFNVTNTGNKYTFSVKPNILQDDKFYSDTYIFTFNTVLTDASKEKVKQDKTMDFAASSKLTRTKGTSSKYLLTSNVDTSVKIYNIITEAVNGTIDDKIDIICEGNDIIVNYKPNDGFTIAKIFIDDEEIELNGYKSSYTFKNVSSDHKIKVVFEQVQSTEGEVSNPPTGAFIGATISVLAILGLVIFVINCKNKKVINKI